MPKSNYTEEITKRIMARAKDYSKEMTSRVREASYGTTRPKPEELVMFMQNQRTGRGP